MPPGLTRSVSLPLDACMGFLPIESASWAVMLQGIDDHLKTSWSQGGKLLGRLFTDWCQRLGVDRDRIWPESDADESTLFNARLWSVGTPDRVADDVAWMLAADPIPPRGWMRRRRYCMEELIGQVNHQRLSDQRRELQRRILVDNAVSLVEHDDRLPAAVVADAVGAQAEASALVDDLVDRAVSVGHLNRFRLLAAADEVSRRIPQVAAHWQKQTGQDLMTAALESVSDMVSEQIPRIVEPPPAQIMHDQAVWVSAPVRIDLAGGWTDTPPVCNEVGGSVVNVAIGLNGREPIHVVAKLIEDPVIMLHSVDLGASERLIRSEQLLDFDRTDHWSSVHKAALMLSGIIPSSPRSSLKRWLQRTGGGISLTTFSAVPKGSGLGTSSIIGASVLACLDRVLGKDSDPDSLIARTSVLEQCMTTRGGWQDQAGGLVGGFKIVRSEPGIMQQPVVTGLNVPESLQLELQRRSILFYTGYKRLAKNILQTVLGRYMTRQPEAIQIIEKLKSGAEQMAGALENDDLRGFTTCLSDYWQYKRLLDPASTTRDIESLIKPIASDIAAWELPGAGGGGFAFIIAKSGRAADRIRLHLSKSQSNPHARLFSFDVCMSGMKATTL